MKLNLFMFQAVPCKDGYSTLAALCSNMGIYGYQLRPKLHMQTHITFLGISYKFAAFNLSIFVF